MSLTFSYLIDSLCQAAKAGYRKISILAITILPELQLQAFQVAVGTPVDLTPPARIRTCRIAACGSYLGCLASKRRLG